MKVLSQQTTLGYGANNNTAFKSALLYSPKSPLHKINPVIRFMDDVFQRSLTVSRKLWLSANEEIAPYLTIENISYGKNFTTRAWDINKGNRSKYLIVLHGLSHNISSLQELYQEVINKTEYAVLAPEYYGFTPENQEFIYLSPQKLLKSTNAALKYLRDKGIKESDIAVLGHSFGGFPAADFAEKHPQLERLILVSCINTNLHWADAIKNGHPKGVPTNIQKLVRNYKIATMQFGWIFNTAKRLKGVKVPVDIIHAREDKRVKKSTAEKLANQCQNLHSLLILNKGSHKMDSDKIDTIVSVLNN